MQTLTDVLRFLVRHGPARNERELAELEAVIADHDKRERKPAASVKGGASK